MTNYFKGFGINAKLGWILQELPALILPTAFFWETRHETNITQQLLLGMFILHYVQRALVFPMFMRQGTSIPFLIFLSAFGFCFFNGSFQSHCIIYLGHYKSNEVISPRFIIGKNVDRDIYIHGVSVTPTTTTILYNVITLPLCTCIP